MEERRLEIKVTYVRDGTARVERFAPGACVSDVCRRIGARPGVLRIWWIDQGRYLQPSECQPACRLEPGIYKCDDACDDEQPVVAAEECEEEEDAARWPPARLVALQQGRLRGPMPEFERSSTGSGNGVLIVIVGVAIVLLLTVTLILTV